MILFCGASEPTLWGSPSSNRNTERAVRRPNVFLAERCLSRAYEQGRSDSGKCSVRSGSWRSGSQRGYDCRTCDRSHCLWRAIYCLHRSRTWHTLQVRPSSSVPHGLILIPAFESKGLLAFLVFQPSCPATLDDVPRRRRGPAAPRPRGSPSAMPPFGEVEDQSRSVSSPLRASCTQCVLSFLD